MLTVLRQMRPTSLRSRCVSYRKISKISFVALFNDEELVSRYYNSSTHRIVTRIKCDIESDGQRVTFLDKVLIPQDDITVRRSPDSICWYKNGKRHRDNDEPAMVIKGNYSAWYQEDKYHRDGDKPAIIYTNGSMSWYQHGRLHRDNDKPAIIDCSDPPHIMYQYWINGELIKEVHTKNDSIAE